jgi:MSHA pilin protein MshA
VNTQHQKGFTMIELIMVIVILGILAATALPKFVDLGKDARAAALQSMYGSLNSSIAMIHGAALIAGQTTGNLTVAGVGAIALTNGYPQNTAANLNNMLQYNIKDFTVVNGSITHAGAKNAPANCRITIGNATNVAGTITSPQVRIDTGDCS